MLPAKEVTSNTIANRFGRRITSLARRASASVLSAVAPVANITRSTTGSRVMSIFFEEATVRVIPKALESNRALVELSLSTAVTTGTPQSVFGLDGSTDSRQRQSQMDIESAVGLSDKSPMAVQKGNRTLSGGSSSRVKFTPTGKQSRVIAWTPQVAENFDPAPLLQDPMEMIVRLEDDLQQWMKDMPPDDRELFAKQWR